MYLSSPSVLLRQNKPTSPGTQSGEVGGAIGGTGPLGGVGDTPSKMIDGISLTSSRTMPAATVKAVCWPTVLLPTSSTRVAATAPDGSRTAWPFFTTEACVPLHT